MHVWTPVREWRMDNQEMLVIETIKTANPAHRLQIIMIGLFFFFFYTSYSENQRNLLKYTFAMTVPQYLGRFYYLFFSPFSLTDFFNVIISMHLHRRMTERLISLSKYPWWETDCRIMNQLMNVQIYSSFFN